MAADPLTEILKLVNAETVVTGGFSAGGAWAIRFPGRAKIKFFAVVKGRCLARIDGAPAPVWVEAGDVVLLAMNRSSVLSSDLALAPVDAASLFAALPDKHARLGTGEDFVHIGGHVELDLTSGRLLADVLPAYIHARAAVPSSSTLQWLLAQLVTEREAHLAGAGIASAQLAQLLLVHLMRIPLAQADPLPPGWLRAIADPRIEPALRLIHGDPGRAWQLEELAAAVAMSRTTFAVRFKAAAGMPPLAYLLHWRMQLARRALCKGDVPVAVLAQSLGYASESAFSNAFKRVIGKTPSYFRRVKSPNLVEDGSITDGD